MPEDQRGRGGRSAGEGTTSSAEDFPDALGRAIKVVRAGRDLGRRELAEAAGLSYSYLAEIENGTKQPSSRAILAIADALGIPAHELMAAADTLRAPPPDETSSSPLSWLARYSSGPTPPQAEVRDEALGDAPVAALRSAPSDPRLLELVDLFRDLAPEDQARLLDMARRLAGC